MYSVNEKHFTTSGFVMNRERTKLLMIYHKKFNIWTIPGGHLEPNEYPAEGVAREIREETGIDVEVIDSGDFGFVGSEKESVIATPYTMLSEFIPQKGDKPAHIHIDFIFLCIADEKPPVKQEAEVEDVRWMTWKEVLALDTFKSVRVFAEKMAHQSKPIK